MVKVVACMESELGPGEMRNLSLMGRWILIANVEGDIYAVDGLCPHQGANMADGVLEGSVLRCPLHGAEYDIRTGKMVKGPWGGGTTASLRSYPVTVEEGCINIVIT